MAYAEAVFLVHHHQAQVLEGHVLLQHAVGADDDVDEPGGEVLERLLHVLAGDETAEALHPHRIGLEAAAEGFQVLLRQDGGGGEHGHLLPVHRRHEGRPHGHLGLAVAHVAADQAVHGLALGHVLEGCGDGLLLIGRFLVFEGGLELPIRLIGDREVVALVQLPGGVDPQQLLGHGHDGLARPGLELEPGGAAQPVQNRGAALGADELLHQIDAVDGQIETVASLVLQVQELALGARHLEVLEAAIDADALVEVHHHVVLPQLAQAGDEVARGLPLANGGVAFPAPPQLLQGDDDQPLVGYAHSLGQPPQHDPGSVGGAGHEFMEGPFGDRNIHLVIGQQLLQPLRVTRVSAHEEHPLVPPLVQMLHQRGQGAFRSLLGGELAMQVRVGVGAHRER